MYRFIKGSEVVATVSNPVFVLLQSNGALALTTETEAQGVVVDGTVYHLLDRPTIGDEFSMEPFIKINGHPYPTPRRGLNMMVATIVNSGRNADGEVVGQKVGRDQEKLDSLQWAYLTAAQWSALLQEFKNFYVTVTYPDMVTGTWTTRKMYPGDRTATPFHLDPLTGLPLDYLDCKVNLIDCGSPL